MASAEDRTGNKPTPLTEDQARTVVGGEDPGGGGDQPVSDPCQQSGCNCGYSDAPNCTCQNHPHNSIAG